MKFFAVLVAFCFLSTTSAVFNGKIVANIYDLLGISNWPSKLSPTNFDVNFYVMTSPGVFNYGSKTLLNQDSDATAWKNSGWNKDAKTIFFIHGFGSTKDKFKEMATTMTEEEGDVYNVVAVDWSKGAKTNYKQATRNTERAGKYIARGITNAGMTLSQVYLVGHSLGAHVSGFAGKELKGKLARITGLDPAQPGYSNQPSSTRLDPGDAQFVDVIHTDGDLLGAHQIMGHIDFYPDGGYDLKACPRGLFTNLFVSIKKLFTSPEKGEIACDHIRVKNIYRQSIRPNPSTGCKLYGYRCNSYKDFQSGNCDYKHVTPLGLTASKKYLGSYYLYLKSSVPQNDYSKLCTPNYIVKVYFQQASSKSCYHDIKLDNQADRNDHLFMNKGQTFNTGQTYSMVIRGASSRMPSSITYRSRRKTWLIFWKSCDNTVRIEVESKELGKVVSTCRSVNINKDKTTFSLKDKTRC